MIFYYKNDFTNRNSKTKELQMKIKFKTTSTSTNFRLSMLSLTYQHVFILNVKDKQTTLRIKF